MCFCYDSKIKKRFEKLFLELSKSQSLFFFLIALAFVCSGYEALLLPVRSSVWAVKQGVSEAESE